MQGGQAKRRVYALPDAKEKCIGVPHVSQTEMDRTNKRARMRRRTQTVPSHPQRRC